MRDDVKAIVEWLRDDSCGSCVFQRLGDCQSINDCMTRKAADLIEALSAELEQVTRERDAAVRALTPWNCFSCKHAGYAHSEVCASCIYNRNRIAKGYVAGKNRYEWRGVKEDSK